MSLSRRACILLVCCPLFAIAQQSFTQEAPGQTQPTAKEPTLQLRPSPSPGRAAGQIQLDVVVEARAGAPVSGLSQKDFTLLDDKTPRNIVAFQAVDGAAPTAAQVEVIVLHDLVNSSFEPSAVAQQQIVKFLRQNGGHLRYPTSIAIFAKDGLHIRPTTSMDGNQMAAQLDATVRTIGASPTMLGEVARFQTSLKALLDLADNKARSPARKILIWTGPGWPMLAGSKYTSSSQDRLRDFNAIVEVSTRLREAHIALYSISPLNPAKPGTPGQPVFQPYSMPTAEAPQQPRVVPNMSASAEGTSYKEFLKGVKSAKQADAGYLALQVLAVQSGGRALDPNNDLAGDIAGCVGDLSPFYRISFVPDRGGHPDDYHDLRFEIAKPGLTARSSTGFYNQPDQTGPAAGAGGKTLAASTPAESSPAAASSGGNVTAGSSARAAATASATTVSSSTVSEPAVPSAEASAEERQNGPQPSEHAIQVNVNRVLVPVVVRDKRGLVVEDLKKEDFRILDDGKPRSISSFTVERRAPVKAAEKSPQPANATSAPAQPEQSSAVPARTIVFLFDDLHMSFEDIAHVRKASLGALGALSDADMAAVVTTSRTNSGLTRDHQKLQDAISKLEPVGLYDALASDCPSLNYFQANLIENQHDSRATADAIEHVFNCNPALNRQSDQAVAVSLVSAAARHVVGVGRQGVQRTLAVVQETVRRMAGLPGERTLVLVSSGFPTIDSDAWTVESQIIDLAARSAVTVSALDARGLYTTSMDASEQVAGGAAVVQYQSDTRRSSMSSGENPLSELASGTGGSFFHNSNDLDVGLQHLTEAPEPVYLLEFSPDDARPDGHYHRLAVAIDREGLQTQARKGYFMPKPDKK